MSKIHLIMLSRDRFQLSAPLSGGRTFSVDASRALKAAINKGQAIAGEPFTVGLEESDFDLRGATIQAMDDDEGYATVDKTSSSSSDRSAVSLETVSIHTEKSTIIPPEILTLIRSFTAEAEFSEMTFLDHRPGKSPILAHRAKVMWLHKHAKMALSDIKEAVDNKMSKAHSDSKVRAAILGIPKRRFELILCDSVLVGVSAAYGPHLLVLWGNGCKTDAMSLAAVPEYVGTGGRAERERGVIISPEERQVRKQTYDRNVADYLRPLFSNRLFRDMISAAARITE